jgi:hypothetical protein
MRQLWAVLQVSECCIALGAKQPTNPLSFMVMVHKQPPIPFHFAYGCSTNGATSALLGKQCIVVFCGDSVPLDQHS